MLAHDLHPRTNSFIEVAMLPFLHSKAAITAASGLQVFICQALVILGLLHQTLRPFTYPVRHKALQSPSSKLSCTSIYNYTDPLAPIQVLGMSPKRLSATVVICVWVGRTAGSSVIFRYSHPACIFMNSVQAIDGVRGKRVVQNVLCCGWENNSHREFTRAMRIAETIRSDGKNTYVMSVIGGARFSARPEINANSTLRYLE